MSDGVLEDPPEDARPTGSGLSGAFTAEPLAQHNARTRRWIALGVLALLAVLYLLVTLCWLFGVVETDNATKFLLAFSGIQSLAAAIVGYYFGKDT